MSRFLASSAVAIVLWQVALSVSSPQGAAHRTDPIRILHANGTVEEEYSLDSSGRFHGLCRQWYPDGTLKREIYSVHGSWESIRAWWPNGTLEEESTTHLLESTRRYWDEDGRPRE